MGVCYMMLGGFDELAYQGPLILTIVVAVQLASAGQWPFFVAFLAGFWLNNRLNEGLKGLIREPRPKPFDLKGAQMRDPLRIIRRWWSREDGIYLSRSHLWGMPSGHAQMASFVLAFYYFVRGNYLRLGSRFDVGTLLFGAMCLLLMMTLYQRWDTKAHTIAQLVMGTIVGVLFAWGCVFGVKWWLIETRKKKDD